MRNRQSKAKCKKTKEKRMIGGKKLEESKLMRENEKEEKEKDGREGMEVEVKVVEDKVIGVKNFMEDEY